MGPKQTLQHLLSTQLGESIEHISTRQFYGNQMPLLPSYILYLLGVSEFKYILVLVCAVCYFICWRVASAVLKRAGVLPSLPMHIISLCAFFWIFWLGSIDGSGIGILLFVMFLDGLSQKRLGYAALASCLAIICDLRYLGTLALLGVFQMREVYMCFINPKNRLRTAIWKAIKAIAQLILLPVVAFSALVALDMFVRSRHSQYARHHSLRFQTCLSGWSCTNVTNPLIDTEYSPGAQGAMPTDQYVTDRSTVSLMNAKHRGYLSPTCETASRLLEVQKIHEQGFEDEEPRFIKSGDTVKLRSVGDDTFLGLTLAENKEEKLEQAKFGTFSNDNDFWRVECEGYLTARSGPVKFVHSNTGLSLCCTMGKKQMSIYGSLYSEKSSQLFYIMEVMTHPYYKANFNDPRIKMQVQEFPGISFIEKACAYIARSPTRKEGAGLFGEARIPSCILLPNLVVGCMLCALLFGNYIVSKRYGVCIEFCDLSTSLSMLFLLTIYASLSFPIDDGPVCAVSIMFNYITLISIRTKRSVIFMTKDGRKYN